jgi:hypothetical protein
MMLPSPGATFPIFTHGLPLGHLQDVSSGKSGKGLDTVAGNGQSATVKGDSDRGSERNPEVTNPLGQIL